MSGKDSSAKAFTLRDPTTQRYVCVPGSGAPRMVEDRRQATQFYTTRMVHHLLKRLEGTSWYGIEWERVDA